MEYTAQFYLDTRIRLYEAMARVSPYKHMLLRQIQFLLDTDRVQSGQTKILSNDIDNSLHIPD